MKVAVCAKQIPGPDVPARLDPATMTLTRPRGLVFDESDSFSLEIALQLVEAHGGSITAVSMAPEGESSGLRTALAMGADEAILVSDAALAGSDALSTAKVLAAVMRLVEPDLVLCATESSDGYSGMVPVQIAELLDYPCMNFVRHVELDDAAIVAERQTEEGYDVVRCTLPVVLAVTAGVVEPRYPTLKGTIAARTKPLRELSLADLGIAPDTVGARGARQLVTGVDRAPARASGELIRDNGRVEEEILARLKAWMVL